MNMKQFKINKLIAGLLCAVLLFSACNKDVPDPVPIPRPEPGPGLTIGDIITRDTSFSYLLRCVNRVGLSDGLFTSTNNFTVFAPPNAVFRGFMAALGMPTRITYLDTIPLTTLAPLINYHVLGYKVPASSISETFPNQLTHSMFALPGAPAPFVRAPLFPSRRGTSAWVNNVPVAQADVQASNGVIHVIAGMALPTYTVTAVATPPGPTTVTTLSQLIKVDTTLSFLEAAIARADEGQVGMNRLDSVLNLAYGPNLTVFAPNNNAFRALLTALGAPPVEGSIGALDPLTVRAIVSYHVLGTRVFSPNLPATAISVPTLLTAAIPGTTVSVSTAGVKGLANPTTSNITSANRNVLNGVAHVIDQVLRFQ
jgi:uncharacterized surface protein with fasciclin (FAS1) repeats